jgi:hypothetical protein
MGHGPRAALGHGPQFAVGCLAMVEVAGQPDRRPATRRHGAIAANKARPDIRPLTSDRWPHSVSRARGKLFSEIARFFVRFATLVRIYK